MFKENKGKQKMRERLINDRNDRVVLREKGKEIETETLMERYKEVLI